MRLWMWRYGGTGRERSQLNFLAYDDEVKILNQFETVKGAFHGFYINGFYFHHLFK